MFPIWIFILAQTGHPFSDLSSLWHPVSDARLASGMPGPAYWQQRADYRIDVILDPAKKRCLGHEEIAYTNHSPHDLSFLWLALDQNIYAPNSLNREMRLAPDFSQIGLVDIYPFLVSSFQESGIEKLTIRNDQDDELDFTIRGTHARVLLSQPLTRGSTLNLRVTWEMNIPMVLTEDDRSGYEPFDDGADVYMLGHWFPRIAAYTDYGGWQIRPFTAASEFTLEFGNYDVSITVPENHLVAATGTLTNGSEVLSSDQRRRLDAVKNHDDLVVIQSEEEARQASKRKVGGTKTWRFQAESVRDFAWSCSSQFVWEAKGSDPRGPSQ